MFTMEGSAKSGVTKDQRNSFSRLLPDDANVEIPNDRLRSDRASCGNSQARPFYLDKHYVSDDSSTSRQRYSLIMPIGLSLLLQKSTDQSASGISNRAPLRSHGCHTTL